MQHYATSLDQTVSKRLQDCLYQHCHDRWMRPVLAQSIGPHIILYRQSGSTIHIMCKLRNVLLLISSTVSDLNRRLDNQIVLALVNKLVSCAWLFSGAPEIWRVRYFSSVCSELELDKSSNSQNHHL